MTSRRVMILAALAVLVIAGALLLSRRESAGTASSQRALLFPDLKGRLDTIDSVRIFKAGDTPLLEAKRTGAEWSITNRDGYPGDASKVRKFLIAASDAKLVEEKTSNPANYAALSVEDVSDAAAKGHRVEIGSATPLNLIIGKQASGSRAQYVRRVGEKSSWQINDSLDLPTTIDTWLRKEIIDVTADRVQSATVSIAGSKPYSVAKTRRDAGDFTVDGLPKGKELSSPSAANAIGSALTALTLADVSKSPATTADKPTAHATIRTFDGLVTDLDGWSRDSKRYVTVMTSYDAALAQRFKPAAPAADAPKPDATAPLPKPATPDHDAAAESKSLNEKLTGWTYEIPEYKYEAIFKPVDELLKK